MSKDHLRLWLRMLKTTRGVENELRERLRVNFRTTLPRFDVMAALYRYREGLRMSDLSRELMVSNGNVTGIVARLAEDGLITHEVNANDRRAKRVRLTEKGVADFEKQAAAHEGWIAELLGGLDAPDITHLLNALAQKEPDRAN